MPVVNPKNVHAHPDFPFRQFGVYFFKPDEYPSDRHYHDCDEAWVVVSGKARVLSEGREYTVSAGDVVWTRMGDEHQLIEILESPYGVVWMANELRGRKRPGHLVKGSDA